MTKIFEEAVEAARSLPPDMQDALGHTLLQFAGVDQPAIQLTAEEEASFDESLHRQGVENLRRMNRYAQSGQSMAFEASLHPSRRAGTR